ncbi:hypothetical protein [Tautonia marina]|uniref:hypothetical protein n=1 Tax=Tautonia marina TaxID=2653855 RepID=UPI001260B6AF|nr:hypothetical protein [Tautonia marina]
MPIDMPTLPGFNGSRFGLETNTQRFESPFTRSVQRVALGGSRWIATYSLPPMKRERAAEWQAFFLNLEGGANTFNAFDPDARRPRGVATGSPLVKGGSQTGSTLNIDGATANILAWLRPGDYFSVNGELKMVTAPANTDSSGEATISFKPALRNSPPDNTPIILDKPTCTMALVDDQQAIWECDVVGLYQPKTFSAIEVFS